MVMREKYNNINDFQSNKCEEMTALTTWHHITSATRNIPVIITLFITFSY